MNYKDLSIERLAHLQKIYSKKKYLTVDEAGIWLCLNPTVVRRYLFEGKIVGIKPFRSRIWRVDVQRTIRQMEQNTVEPEGGCHEHCKQFNKEE